MPVKQKLRQLTNVLIAICAGLMVAPLAAQVAPPETQRISFQIATGPVSSSYLRVGETIAGIISNPPGLGRCRVAGVCGPEGLIATSRSSGGSVANAIAVNSGRVKSAIVQGDIAAAAIGGTGPFKEIGPLQQLRAIARLHDETLHLVVASRSRIRKLSDLRGKRVAIDAPTSATNHTVRSLLGAAKISPSRVRLSFESGEQAAEALRAGRIDAFFVIGIAPVKVVDGLARRGQARVIGIDARAVSQLAQRNALFSRHVLPGDTYRASRAVTTLNVGTVWVVQKSMPDSVVRGVLRSLWNPANKGDLRRLGKAANTIVPARAAENLPLPLHGGAERFYAEAGR